MLLTVKFQNGKANSDSAQINNSLYDSCDSMVHKINLYFTKQTISQCVFIDLFDHFYASVFIFDGLKDELMQGRPDPVLKCPEQAQSDRKPSGIVSLVDWVRTSLCEHFYLPPLLRFRSNPCFFRYFFHRKFFVLSSDHNK